MNDGRIVLACPGAGGARDRLIANLLVFDVLHAAGSRAHVPPERRRGSTSSSTRSRHTTEHRPGTSPRSWSRQRQVRGPRRSSLNQNPERLTSATLNALTTNRSHLIATALNAHAAALIAREWGGRPAANAITGPTPLDIHRASHPPRRADPPVPVREPRRHRAVRRRLPARASPDHPAHDRQGIRPRQRRKRRSARSTRSTSASTITSPSKRPTATPPTVTTTRALGDATAPRPRGHRE